MVRNSYPNEPDMAERFERFDGFLGRLPVSVAFFSVGDQWIQFNYHFRSTVNLKDTGVRRFTLCWFFGEDERKYHEAGKTRNKKTDYYCDELRYVIRDGDIVVVVAHNITITKTEQRKAWEKEIPGRLIQGEPIRKYRSY